MALYLHHNSYSTFAIYELMTPSAITATTNKPTAKTSTNISGNGVCVHECLCACMTRCFRAIIDSLCKLAHLPHDNDGTRWTDGRQPLPP